MHTITIERTTPAVIIAFVLLTAGVFLTPVSVRAATCVFSPTNLEIGLVSEEVRCLQQYLNSAGYTVSTTGVGSKGSETNQYQAKTAAAVMKWQEANGIRPATGTFGPLSRAKYILLKSGEGPASVPSALPVLTSPPSSDLTSNTAVMKSARTAVLAARDDHADALDEYLYAVKNKKSVGKSKVGLDKANVTILRALYAFIEEDYVGAQSLAQNARSAVSNAAREISTKGTIKKADRTEAKVVLKDAQDSIDDAWDEIDKSKSSNSRIRKAEDLLARAEERLERAKSSYSDGYYDEAIEYADEAMDLVDDAHDAL